MNGGTRAGRHLPAHARLLAHSGPPAAQILGVIRLECAHAKKPRQLEAEGTGMVIRG